MWLNTSRKQTGVWVENCFSAPVLFQFSPFFIPLLALQEDTKENLETVTEFFLLSQAMEWFIQSWVWEGNLIWWARGNPSVNYLSPLPWPLFFFCHSFLLSHLLYIFLLLQKGGKYKRFFWSTWNCSLSKNYQTPHTMQPLHRKQHIRVMLPFMYCKQSKYWCTDKNTNNGETACSVHLCPKSVAEHTAERTP